MRCLPADRMLCIQNQSMLKVAKKEVDQITFSKMEGTGVTNCACSIDRQSDIRKLTYGSITIPILTKPSWATEGNG